MSKKNDEENKKNSFTNLKEETVKTIWAITFFVLTFFFLLSAFGKGGVAGKNIYKLFSYLMGIGYYLLPFLFTILGISFLKNLKGHFVVSKIIGSLLFFLSGLGIINLLSKGNGGIIGSFISLPLIKLFDFYVSIIFFFALIIISVIIIFDTSLNFKRLLSLFANKKKDEEKEKIKEIGEAEIEKITTKKDGEIDDEEKEKKEKKNKKVSASSSSEQKEKNKNKDFSIENAFYFSGRSYTPPPLSLIEGDRGKPGVGDIKANANIIKRTLQNFGIIVEMDEISIGPSITRYALKPAEGVKISRILSLQNDLSLALAAHPIRIETPIPGKSLVGIEIPNNAKTTVGLSALLSSEEYQKSEKSLLVALGKSVTGKSYFGNIAKMPHMLIAGATGSGKSVTIHTLVTSLLYRNSPENLKLILIDPKRVELTLYNKIPHLLTPVITDAKKAILSLKWAAKEMDRRYGILEAEAVRDIESYHKNVFNKQKIKKEKGEEKRDGEFEEATETMPFIVIIIDELADIMSVYPRELESAIIRLAQMSRAVGIHLVLSTQRPSVNIITGLIKANIPSRIAMQVASQIDSRTILDTGGAEKLLGSGDMLYLSGEMSKPLRLQSAFISETEVKNVVKYLIDTYKDEIPSEINLAMAEHDKNAIFSARLDSDIDDENVGEDGDDDLLYEEARELIIKAGKASTSYLQRRLRIGYARAARLVDMLEERGVIGHADGARPREVIGIYKNNEENDVKKNENISVAEKSGEENEM